MRVAKDIHAIRLDRLNAIIAVDSRNDKKKSYKNNNNNNSKSSKKTLRKQQHDVCLHDIHTFAQYRLVYINSMCICLYCDCYRKTLTIAT